MLSFHFRRPSMPAGPEGYAFRECAQEIIALFNKYGDNAPRLSDGILTATRGLLDHADLATRGAKRPGNFVTNSRYLYYDGQLEITLNQMPAGKQFPAHDHGTCEALIIYSGQLSHTVYERVDDGRRDGYAELKIIEDRVLTRGDIALMKPPVEIHSFRALTDDTFVLTVVEGQYKIERHFYRPEERTYSINTPQAVR
jgi:predicted metal-dependent enzyme (double-stranded beta helix superfamily)